MLKIIHVLTGVAALVLSFLPSLTGALPLLVQPEALALLFLGLLNVQFASFGPLHMHGRGRPVLLGASVLLVVAVAVQAATLQQVEAVAALIGTSFSPIQLPAASPATAPAQPLGWRLLE